MSGPKYVEFDVTLNGQERAEFLAAISRLRGGVTVSGSTVRVAEHLSVAEVRRMVTAAKEEAARKEQQRRLEELKAAKQREKARVAGLASKVNASVQEHAAVIRTAIEACTRVMRAAATADTQYKMIRNISTRQHAETMQAEVARLNQELSNLEQVKQARLAEIDAYRASIDGHTSIESLTNAVSRSPAEHLVFSHSEARSEELCVTVQSALEKVSVLRAYLNKVDAAIGEDAELRSLVAKINGAISACDLSSPQSILDCINTIAAVEREFLAAKRSEELGAILAQIRTLEQEARNLSAATEGAVRQNTVNYKEVCKGHLAQLKEAVQAVEGLSYIAPEKKAEFASLKAAIASLSRKNHTAAEERQLSELKMRMSRLVDACRTDEANYAEFERYNHEYQETIKRIGNRADVFKPKPIAFIPSKAAECIKIARDEAARLDTELKLLERDVRAAQLITSLESREDNRTECYTLFHQEADASGNLRLSFAKEKQLGIAFVWVIEPGGRCYREPVRIEGTREKPLMDREQFLNCQHETCGDLQRLQHDVAQMGSEMLYTEAASPEDAFGDSRVVKLDEETMRRYLVAVYGEEGYAQGMQIVALVSEGMTQAEAELVVQQSYEAAAQDQERSLDD